MGVQKRRARRTGEPDMYLEPHRTYLRHDGWEALSEEQKSRCPVILGLNTSVFGTSIAQDYDFIPGSSQMRSAHMTGPAIVWESGLMRPVQSLLSLKPLQNTLDLSSLKRALDYCLQTHDNCGRNDKPPSLLTTLMIDVVKRTVVPCPQNCDYVALSYVWGGVQPSPRALENRCLPQTIEDAMVVTKALGRRYIWVDALCIDQSPNPTPSQMKHKLKQLDMMSTIYGCATVTIVALTGKHANAGLPGISVPRLAQVKENIADCVLFTSPQVSREDRQEAMWSRRAWTLQENVLSRRRLTFTQNQVTFHCFLSSFEEVDDFETGGASSPWEANPEESQDSMASHLRALLELGPTQIPNPTLDSDTSMFLLRGMLRDYTKRQMTNESDSINAFRGMLAVFQKHFPGGFVHGLPLRDHSYSLAWMHWRDITPKRRAMFPSWSWAGWEGEVVYPKKLTEAVDNRSTSSSNTDLELSFLASHGDMIEVEGWVVDLDVRTEPLSEVFIPEKTDSIGTVKEGDSTHNNTLETGHYTCLVVRRVYEKNRGRESRTETVFMLALQQTSQQARRRALLTVTLFFGQSFNQVKREKQVFQLV